ncbi:MAG: hypothetical protein H0T47_07545 [Planctomycetaceae bacterium]|nr:hypothetical protein [Planctomycetaceae bacterium]
MKTQQFLEHHGIRENPFGQEDAQSDHVFKQHCLSGTHHPSWDKIAGNPGEPSTSVVFGEKGSGKTALRLQIVRDVEEHNRTHPDRKVFIVEYDDFNPFLDSFRERLFGRKKNPERALRHWRLWDHMDAILSLAVTRLVRGILDANSQRADAVQINAEDLQKLDRNQKRDLLILAAYYDHSYDQPRYSRWNDLRKKVGFSTWLSDWDWYVGLLVTLLTIGVTGWYAWTEETVSLEIFGRWWFWLILVIGWLPWLFRQTGLLLKAWGVKRQIRVFDHLPNTLRKVLSRFSRTDIAGQPTPNKDRSDDRYEMILKLQGVLKRLGYANMLVLVDRVDEPHLVNGSPERMRDLLWPMFDNKFLKHPGMGFKLLLPAEVTYYLNREEKEFYERSRLDKQNLVPSLDWTGESLYDVANDRLKACAVNGQAPKVGTLFDDGIGREQLVPMFARLRVPRHLFKFLYRLMVEHCNRYTEEEPKWTIGRETLESTYGLYMRDLDAFDRGMGTG